MDQQERIKILKQIDLFRAFTPDELGVISSSTSEVYLDTETVLFEEGSVGRDMYILLEGALTIFKDKRAITTIEPIDYIGEMAIIEDKPRSATVIASERCRLIRITSSLFDTYFSQQPKSLVSMLTSLSKRIRKDTVLIAAEFQKANILIHDMRNAISAFLLMDLMLDGTLTKEQESFIQLMKKSRLDLSEMMDEAMANAKCLQFFRQMTVNSLAELIDELSSTFTVNEDMADKKLKYLTDNNVPDFPFHRVDIRRVITNLVYNAAQASKPGDTITVRLSKTEDHAIVEITDQGTGIPEKIQPQIFIPHFTTKQKGNGLGLASCKQIIEQKHDGKLFFETKTNQGTTFTFTLPFSPKKASIGTPDLFA